MTRYQGGSRAMEQPQSAGMIRFSRFVLDRDSGELLKDGTRIKLQDQPFQILCILLEQPGRIVTRDELENRIWPADTFVEFDQGLYSAVRRLRDALCDSAEAPRYIETLPRRGYRFIAPVETGKTSRDVPSAPPEETSQAPSVDTKIANSGSHPVVAGSVTTGKRKLLAILVLLVCALAATLSYKRIAPLIPGLLHRTRATPNSQAPNDITSLAILPLENLSADPEQDYFAEGMTDELTTDLAQVSGLRVISRSSAMHYRHTQKTLPEIARELGVDAVVEGTWERVGDRVRIRAQLIRTADDRHLWAQAYDREYHDVLALQREAASDIARAINHKLDPSRPQHLSHAGLGNPEAYEAYLKGRYFWHRRSKETNAKSVAYFQRAVQLAPDSAMAYSGLADAYIDSVYWGEAPSVAAALAKTAVKNALERDPDLAEARLARAELLEISEWNWAEADKEYRRALELNPNYALAHEQYAIFLAAMGRFDQATAHALTAEHLDPVSASVYAHGGVVSFFARQDHQAIEQYRKALEIDPNFALALRRLSEIYWHQRKYDESMNELEKADALSHRNPEIQKAIRQAYRRGGHEAVIRKELELDLKGRHPTLRDINRAGLYAGLGEKSQALTFLEKALQEHDPFLEFLSVDPAWDKLRSEPRFQSLARQVGLPADLELRALK